jgi:DNA-binding PadR family transcriptional regulator
MTSQVFHILLSLASGTRHGYGIIKDVRAHTSDEIRIGTGTLYTALQRLLDAGWIEETAERPPDDDDARRQYYKLTAGGREAVRREAERLERAVAEARGRRVLTGRSSKRS